ncbi:gliding motility-associated C-terminal domain-containing protein [Polluticoccus soli]|uniref:gliding motility-associated C-terminal domain-containing protein n=1 Tax=Polluticoccus soli TaxID=3034150 RepID=UPI0023E31585|nr:PKD domain-containing protein [Flavipsychrobacter sp. JY13-12]
MTFKFLPLLALSAILSAQAIAQCIDPFALNVSPGVICTGRSLTLSATNYPGATYTWTGPAGSGIVPGGPSSQTLTGVTVGGHSGIYSVTMTLGACTYTANVNVFVQITPTINSVNHKSPICVGEDEVFVANSASGIGATYDWAGPGGWAFTSTTTNVATRAGMTPADAGNYSVTVTSTAGCTSDPFIVPINVHPQVNSDFATTVMLGCDEDSVKFTNNSTGHNASEWTFGDGGTGIDSDPLHIYKSQGSYTVRLIVTNGVCRDTSLQIVNFNHSVKANFVVSDDSICQNTPITFTNTTAYVPAILPGYKWNFRDGGTDAVVDPTYVYARAGEYRAKLIATDYIGCMDSTEHLIVVDSTGAISFESSIDELCAGQTLNFSGTFMQIGNTGTTWTMGDGNVVHNVPGFNYGYDRAGIYNVVFEAMYRVCPKVQFNKTIIVKPFPIIDLGPDTSICVNGKPVILTDRINNGNPLAKWKWNSRGDNTGASIVARHPGAYSATVEIDGCAATDTVVVANNCYINVPNAFTPNSDGHDDYFLPRQLLSSGVTDFKMLIFNRWGQKVFESTTADGRGWDGSFNNTPQPLGVYVYLIDVNFVNGAQEHYEGNVTLLR